MECFCPHCGAPSTLTTDGRFVALCPGCELEIRNRAVQDSFKKCGELSKHYGKRHGEFGMDISLGAVAAEVVMRAIGYATDSNMDATAALDDMLTNMKGAVVICANIRKGQYPEINREQIRDHIIRLFHTTFNLTRVQLNHIKENSND